MNQPTMSQKTAITVAHGDGIGPEIMEASCTSSKPRARAWRSKKSISARRSTARKHGGHRALAGNRCAARRCFYKAPITTPQGGGFKSLNVTTRKTLGLYANVRPCVAYHPFVDTKHPKMDVVIVRENEEDLYAGIEYRLRPRSHAVPQADLPAGLREDRPLRLRVRRRTTARKLPASRKTTS